MGQSVPVTCTTLASNLLCIQPCLPTFSHLHLGLATLGTLPTLCTHIRLKSIEKNCRAPFQSLQSWAKGIYFRQSPGFPRLHGPEQSRFIQQALLWYAQHNLKLPERNLAKWDLNTADYFLLWRHVAKSCTCHYHDWKCVQREHGNLSSELLFFPFISWLPVVSVNWI